VTVVDSLNPASPAAAGQATPAPAANGQAARPPAIARDPEARLAALFDPGTLALLTPQDDSGALAGTGKIGGTAAVAFASDPRIQGGAMGSAGCAAIVAAYDQALAQGAPVIGLWHSGGARLREGVASLHAVGTVFAAMTRASGKVPQISVVLGPAAGGAAYGPALTDVVILSDQGRIFVTGPDVVRSVTGEDVDMARLGGPEPHSRRSGVVHIVTASDDEALARAREIALLFGEQGSIELGRVQLDTVQQETLRLESGGRDGAGSLASFLPESPRRAYDVKPLVAMLLDEPGIELHPRWAPNVVTTLGRLAGRTVGVIANNPLRLGGCLDATSAEKAARFVRMCDAFGVPRGQAPARVRRGDRAPGDAGDAQGLRRRLHRHELARPGRDQGARLARGRDRGDGGGGRHPDPAPAHPGRRPARAAARGRGRARGQARGGGRRAGAGPGDRRD